MAIGMAMWAPGMTSETYDSVMEHLGWDDQDLPDGFISHYACVSDEALFVFDVWESQADFERFLHERLGAALAAATGGQAPALEPKFFEIHNENHARSRV